MAQNQFVITCPCGQTMRVSGAQVGHRGTCIRCGRTLHLQPGTLAPLDSPSQSTPPATEDSVATEWNVGDVILGLYEVTGVLGQGGMGKVYKVRHRTWGMDLAVKAPRPMVLLRRDGVTRFERECATWIDLGLHPHIVTCYYVRRLGGIPRVFAEYVEGGSLWSWIRERRLYEGGHETALGRMIDIAIQFAWGLQYAHERGFVHQDVKPGNLLVSPSGTAKVCDFGLARAVEIDAQDEENVAQGMTRVYRSPEQARAQESTPQTDMWGWGLAVLEMFCGRHRWHVGEEAPQALQRYVEKSRQAPPEIPIMPGDLVKILARCFRESRAERPESMAEIARLLQTLYRDCTGAEYFRRAPRPADALSDSLNNRAVSLLDLGHRDEARRLWAEALRTDPQHPDSSYNVGLLQWRAGEIGDETLLARLREIDRLHPGDPLAPDRLAQVHLERGDYEAALRLLEESERAGTMPTEAVPALATARERLGRTRGLIQALPAHNDVVTTVCIGAEGTVGLSGSEDNTVRVWDLDERRCVRTLEGHTNTVRALCLDRTAHLAATGGADKTVRLWHLPSGSCLQVFEGHAGPVRSVAISEGGKLVASAAEDKFIRVWEVETSRCVTVLQGHSHWVSAICLSEHGRRLLSAGYDGTLRLWDVESRECMRSMTGHEALIECVAWTSDRRRAFSGDEHGIVKAWRMKTGECLGTVQAHEGAVTGIAVCGNGRHFLTGGRDGFVRLWESDTGRCLRTFEGHKGAVHGVSLTPDGRLALSGGRDRDLRLWRVDCQWPPYLAMPIVCRGVGGEAASSAGAAFADAMTQARTALRSGDAVAAANHLRIARAQPGRRRAPEVMEEWRKLCSRLPRKRLDGAWEYRSLPPQEESLESICTTPDGRRALSIGAQNMLHLWDLTSGRCLRAFGTESGVLKGADLADDGRIAATAGWDIRVWEAGTGQLLRTFDHPSDGVHALCLSPDGALVASGGSESLRVWHVRSGNQVWAAQGHVGEITAMRWSRDGQYILTGGDDTAVVLWDVARCQTLRILRGQGGPIRSVSMSDDGRWVLAASASRWGAPGQLALWDLFSGRHVQTFEGHGGDVSCACLSVDGRYALSGGEDKTVRLWDVSTGRNVLTLEGHGAGIAGVGLSADLCQAVSASRDGVIKHWLLDWELEDRAPADWDNGALPHFRVFLSLHTPFAVTLPEDRRATDAELKAALVRKGRPTWTDSELEAFLQHLGAAGYGWLRTHSIRARLEKAANAWSAPPSVYRGSSVAVRGFARRLKDLLGR